MTGAKEGEFIVHQSGDFYADLTLMDGGELWSYGIVRSLDSTWAGEGVWL